MTATATAQWLLLLLFLWSPVETHAQTEVPYISFNNVTLLNSTFLDISEIGGFQSGDEVRCHTNLQTCCSLTDGLHRGDWYFPNGDRLQFNNEILVERRDTQFVELYNFMGDPTSAPSGIYRCDIVIIAPDDTIAMSTVLVGLYNSTGGDVTIPDDVTLTVISDLNGASPQFTLTCISTGGPATTVTWTRDSATAMGDEMTVLDNAETATYTHTLTVTGRLGGLYTCTVSNDKPSTASENLFMEVASEPTSLALVQEGTTSVRVSWSPPSPLGATTGYRISYSGGSINGTTSGSEDISDGSSDTHTLTDLQNGDSYAISIVGKSQHFYSNSVTTSDNIMLVPGQPDVTVDSTTATTISLSWRVPSGSVVTSYMVAWQRFISENCPDVDGGNQTFTSAIPYTITGLYEGSSYNITVIATNAAGSVVTNTFGATDETVPSAVISSITLVHTNASSITLQWEAVDCIDRNGDITGYSVRFGVDGEDIGPVIAVAPDDVTLGGIYQITGLSASTMYSIQLATVNSAGTGEYGGVTILTNVASPVVSVHSASSTTVTISWTSSGLQVQSYMVMWQRLMDQCPTSHGGNATVSGTTTNFTIMELEDGSSYAVTVKAVNPISEETSSVVNTMTLETAPSAAPTSVSVFGVTSSSITVQWGAVDCIHRNGDITGYSVQYGVQGESATTTVSVSGDSSGRVYTITGLLSISNYTIKVAAENSAGTGVYSALLLQVTLVQAPSIGDATATATSIDVSWTTPQSESSYVTSYEVAWQRDTTGDCPDANEGSMSITDGSTSYTIPELEEYSLYIVTVAATTAAGSSVSSPKPAMTLEAAPSAMPSITNTNIDTTDTSITVQWGAVPCIDRNGDITSYSVQYGVNDNSGSSITVVVMGTALGGTYQITGLEPVTLYDIGVAAVTSAGTGEYREIGVITDAAIPVVSVQSASSTTATISWTSSGLQYSVMWQRLIDQCATAHEDSTTISGETTIYTITDLEENSDYEITVIAVGLFSSNQTSDPVTVRTQEAAPSAAPSNVSASGVTFSSITVQWGAVDCIHRNGDITGYTIMYMYTILGSANTETLTVSGGSTDSATISSGIESNTVYTIQVAASTIVGTGSFSSPVDIPTDKGISVEVDAVNTTTISVSWMVDASITTSAGYTISYSNTDNTECFTDSDTVTGIAASQRSYTVTGLEEATEYNVTVTLLYMSGNTDEDSTSTITSASAPSAAPTSVSTSSTSSSITVQWEAVDCIHRNGDITGYSVRYGVQGNGSTQTASVSGGGATMRTITGLINATSYTVKVAAVNSEGMGPFTDTLVAKTVQAVFLSIGGAEIPSNSYVDIDSVGTVLCSTDLASCCSAGNVAGGGWFYPNRDTIGAVSGSSMGFYTAYGDQTVRLVPGPGIAVSGIYTCSLPDTSSQLQTVYVGMYRASEGNVSISDAINFSFDSGLDGADPQFTLTCISTGGPATTVTWTRDSATAMGDEMTVLDDAETAQYAHTLSVTGRLGGLYTCTVSNDKPSTATISLTVQVASAPSNLMVIQEGPTSVRVSWSPPTPLGDTTGYRISYSGGSSGNVDVSDGSTDNYLLTGIETTTSLSLSIAGTSDHLPSQSLSTELDVLGAPENFQASAGEREVTFSWSAPSVSSPVTGYTLSCSPSPSSLPLSFSESGTHTLAGFSPDTSYNCSLVAYDSQNIGPTTSTAFTTEEDYHLFQVDLSAFIMCSDWVTFSKGQKQEDIRDAVLNELSNSCQCQITSDNIDQEQLACFVESSNYVTYQARLGGTPEQDSGSLVSLINSWVSGGPTILVQGMLMRFGEDCTTTVSDLSAGVCSAEAQTNTASTISDVALTVGIAITAAIVVILVALVVIAIVYCSARHRRNHRFSLQKPPPEDYQVPSPRDLDSPLPLLPVRSLGAEIATNSNVAYEVPDIGRERERKEMPGADRNYDVVNTQRSRYTPRPKPNSPMELGVYEMDTPPLVRRQKESKGESDEERLYESISRDNSQ